MDMGRRGRRTLAKNFASSPLEELMVAAVVHGLLADRGVVMAHQRSPLDQCWLVTGCGVLP